MVHIADYAMKNEADAIKRLTERSVELPPKQWKGYVAIFAPSVLSPKTAPKTTGPYTHNGLYSIYWFASNRSAAFKKALHSIENI